ncbi:BTAD domain-containing putative transcriptional regulator [Pseudonocardia sp. NPDC049154]|uniref:BTAD domain-containing putative transcriptional regulator n=1 Tax=Pseudonocardia sp. NPDC049154 TaxID=3155501 RepID=UPI0033FF02C4
MPADDLGLFPRPGLVGRVAEAFIRASTVVVTAPSGAGKSSLARLVAAERGERSLWVSASPDSGVEELREALDRARSAPFVVLDDLENVIDDPRLVSVLTDFLAEPAAGTEVLALSTRALGPVVGTLVLQGTCEVIDAADLLVGRHEVVGLAAAVRPGLTEVEAARMVDRARGWIAGAVLLMRLAGPAGPLSPVVVDVVEATIVDALPLDEQDLLLAGSLLDRLTRQDAVGLLGPRGEAVFGALRTRVLPMVTRGPGREEYTAPEDALCFAPLLRDCLHEILPHRRAGRLPELRRRFAMHLSLAGRFDAAVDWCVRAGDPRLAVEVLEEGVRRLPDPTPAVPLVERWVELIGEPYLLASDVLTACRIRSLHALRRIDRAVVLIHQLERDGRMDDVVAVDPGIVGVVLWILHSRPGEAEHYVDDKRDGHRADAVRFMIAATNGTEPALPPLTTRWQNMAPVVHWGMLWQGRCAEILGAVGTPDADDNPNIVLAAAWTGQLELASAAWEAIPADRSSRPHAQFARAALIIAQGDTGRAGRMLQESAEAARSTGGENHHEILAAWAALKAGAPAEAVEALRPGLIELEGVERRAITEWARVVLGLAFLELDRPRDAMDVLAPAVESMLHARRHLMVAAAGYALAEAHCRLADEASARAVLADVRSRVGALGSSYWADVALDRCYQLRSGDLLNLATSQEVAEPSGASEDSATSAVSTTERLPERVELRPFREPPGIVVDGVESTARRMKVVELIADLAQHSDGIERSRLQERLFPEVARSRGGNHFRQIIFRLRELTGVRLERSDNMVAWPKAVRLTAEDDAFEQAALVARGVREPTGADIQALRAAVDLAPGVYLPGSDLAWVEQRRVYLSVLHEEAVSTLLWWAVEASDVDMVRQYASRALEINPFSEEIYGLLMRAEHLGGNRVAAMAVYRRAHSALAELGLEPGPELRRLAHGAAAPPTPRATRARR